MSTFDDKVQAPRAADPVPGGVINVAGDAAVTGNELAPDRTSLARGIAYALLAVVGVGIGVVLGVIVGLFTGFMSIC